MEYTYGFEGYEHVVKFFEHGELSQTFAETFMSKIVGYKNNTATFDTVKSLAAEFISCCNRQNDQSQMDFRLGHGIGIFREVQFIVSKFKHEPIYSFNIYAYY